MPSSPPESNKPEKQHSRGVVLFFAILAALFSLVIFVGTSFVTAGLKEVFYDFDVSVPKWADWLWQTSFLMWCGMGAVFAIAFIGSALIANREKSRSFMRTTTIAFFIMLMILVVFVVVPPFLMVTSITDSLMGN